MYAFPVSIDCGASGNYTDENSIVWIGDDSFFKNSESAVVRSNNTVSHLLLWELRLKKSSPPSFLLLLDGNYWSTVKTTLDEPGIYEEVGFENVCHIVDPNYALYVRARGALGDNSTVRFPDDVYDRMWSPARIFSGRVPVTSDAKLIDVTTAPDNPPRKVLQNAITTSIVRDRLNDGTYSKDVEGLGELLNSFSVLQEIWSGDPCLPSAYTWDRISCSNDVIPRVTALDLSSLDLSGPLPDFSSMDALVT
ncbi:hypothetical protein OIU78_021177, partial [Salix suchowensis]